MLYQAITYIDDSLLDNLQTQNMKSISFYISM